MGKSNDFQRCHTKKPTYEKKRSVYDKPDFGKTKDNIYYNRNSLYKGTTRWFETFYLFAQWKGSVYKLLWRELIFFLACYFALNIIYRTLLCNEELLDPIHKQRFELVCIYSSRFSGSIPIALLTGFYCTSVLSRWWDQFMSLPYPDKLALKLVAYVPGHVSTRY